MSMSKRDYCAIAQALDYQRQIAANGSAEAVQTVTDCVCAVANIMQADNPKFDRERFLFACGIR